MPFFQFQGSKDHLFYKYWLKTVSLVLIPNFMFYGVFLREYGFNQLAYELLVFSSPFKTISAVKFTNFADILDRN